jgi:hypothetical protein
MAVMWVFSKAGASHTNRFSYLLINLVRHVVSPLVSGVSGACFEKYPTEKDARAAFEQAVVHDSVTIV